MVMTQEDISEIIHLAWCDKTSFDEIQMQYGLTEPEVKALMRATLKRSSFKMWRRRVTGRKAKHKQRLRPLREKNGVLSTDRESKTRKSHPLR
jgi:uncharacterized protein (TIGR03643 family)